MLNPPSGYVQNCNSTPYTTTDNAGPAIGDYPNYMVEDLYDDKRRAKISRLLLREAGDVTFEKWQELSFDTTIYWALTELPRYAHDLDKLRKSNPELAAQSRTVPRAPVGLELQGTIESTQATLCLAWYEELYGFGYPGRDAQATVRVEPGRAIQGPDNCGEEAGKQLRQLEDSLRPDQSPATAR